MERRNGGDFDSIACAIEDGGSGSSANHADAGFICRSSLSAGSSAGRHSKPAFQTYGGTAGGRGGAGQRCHVVEFLGEKVRQLAAHEYGRIKSRRYLGGV